MPWTAADADKYNKGLSRKDKRMWVSVANSTLKSCVSKGGSESECAAKAIKIANGVLKRRKEKEMAQTLEKQVASAQAASAEKVAETQQQPAQSAEMGNMEMPEGYVPWGIYSFGDLDAVEQASEVAHEVSELTEQFTGLVRNIVLALEGDKLAALKTVSDEFITRLGELMGGGESESTASNEYPEEVSKEVDVPIFREAETMQIIEVKEAAAGANQQPTVPMEMLVQIIQPGWGNKVDNHFYPEEVVRRDAGRFAGAKMFESDHRDEQKSTRTWVSTIASVDYFTESGAPVAKVIVHDAGFAARVRALNAANLLNKMECSIYASGKAVDGYKEGERKGKKITEITDVASVDWVTRAGAGGRALELTESNSGGDMKTEEAENKLEENIQATEQNTAEKAVSIVEAGVESDPVAEPEQTPTAEATEQPVEYLAVEKVAEMLAASKLPKPAVERLGQRQYLTEEEFNETVAAELAYLEAVTGAGRPVGLGETASSKRPVLDLAKVAEAADRVNSKYFGK